MVNVTLGDKTYTGVAAVKTDTTDGGTAEFAPYDETFAAGKAEGIEEGYANGKTDGYAEGKQVGIDEGVKTEYDRFWDAYQPNKGAPAIYRYGFCWGGWNDTTFYPKYDIVVSSGQWDCESTFRSCAVTDIAQRLREIGRALDTSRAIYAGRLFQETATKSIPALDLSLAESAEYAFFWALNLEKIEKIVANETCLWSGTFQNTPKLSNVTFDGVIGQDINFSWSPLSAASLNSVITHLSGNATGKTATFMRSAVNTAFETAEGAADGASSQVWLDLIATKPNWTISLV